MTRRGVGRGQWLPLVVAAAGVLCASGPALAQPAALGTFRWQLLPYCNVLTLTVVPQGGEFQVDGIDDQCGASRRASVTGRAFTNPDGSIGFGLSTVTTPGATGVHVDATIAIATLSGTWRDSLGQTGGFGFRTGAGTGGTPRPVAASGLPAGVVGGEAFAAGSVGAEALVPAVLGAELNTMPLCEAGQYLRGTTTLGRPVCQAFRAPTSVTLPYGEAWYPLVAVGADGMPTIAHYSQANAALRLTRCIDVACLSGASSTTLSNTQPVSLTIGADGAPTIVGVGPPEASGQQAVRVIRCGNPACSTGNSTFETLVRLSSFARHRQVSTVTGVDGRLVLTYFEAGPLGRDVLRQIYCGDAACSAGNVSREVATVDQAEFATYFSSQLESNGLVRIEYTTQARQDPTQGRGFRVVCSRASCTGPDGIGVFKSDAITVGADGVAIGVVTRRNGLDPGVLEVLRCGDSQCLNYTSAIADAPAGGYVGGFPSIVIGADGLPIISHLDSPAAGLRVTHCGTVRCDAGNQSTTIDDPVQEVGGQTAIAIGADGFPVIVHRDAPAQALRVTKCWSRTCH